MNKISPLAYIDPDAKIGENCEIGPFCYVDRGVVIGDNNVLMNSVTLLYGTRMGNGNTVFPGAVIGAIPQDLKFKGEDTTAEIGDNNTIRENVTINRGTAAKGKTVVGSGNLFMEAVHIAHDALVGNGCIVGNTTKLAGEVIVDDYAIISASVLVHQFCRIGSYVMIGGFSSEMIENIHSAYRLLYQRGKLRDECLAQIEREVPMSKEIEYILDFVKTSKRGIIK